MAEAVFKEAGTRVEYMVGTMIELPRACLQAGAIAETASFFSFGTNDLTQTRSACRATIRGRSSRSTARKASMSRIPSPASTRKVSAR